LPAASVTRDSVSQYRCYEARKSFRFGGFFVDLIIGSRIAAPQGCSSNAVHVRIYDKLQAAFPTFSIHASYALDCRTRSFLPNILLKDRDIFDSEPARGSASRTLRQQLHKNCKYELSRLRPGLPMTGSMFFHTRQSKTFPAHGNPKDGIKQESIDRAADYID